MKQDDNEKFQIAPTTARANPAFANRFERMAADDYSQLAFRTGLIIRRPPEAD